MSHAAIAQRILLDFGAPMAELLAQSAMNKDYDHSLRDYIQCLLAAFRHETSAASSEQPNRLPATRLAPEAANQSHEALTERELDVLRLFAAGMTSVEIAQHFVVSINTVKTQLKSIYSKLDIHSRAEIVVRARSLNIIP